MSKNMVLYSVCIVLLVLVALIISITATVLPLWGYFANPAALNIAPGFSDRGHFGPWQVCKVSVYGKPKCGDKVSKFQPKQAVHTSGYFSIVGVIMIVVLCVLNVLHLAKLVSKDKIMFELKNLITMKLFVSACSEIIAVVVAALFASQTDDKEKIYFVFRGESFYMQISLIIINFFLFIAALYDLIFSRIESAGDLTKVQDSNGFHSTIFDNPGYLVKENIAGHPISMTDNSGKPYVSLERENCNIATMDDILCISSNSPRHIPDSRGPLRSSLKKPKPFSNNGLGIPNPSFNQTSPIPGPDTKKKVRIQTESTQV